MRKFRFLRHLLAAAIIPVTISMIFFVGLNSSWDDVYYFQYEIQYFIEANKQALIVIGFYLSTALASWIIFRPNQQRHW